MKQLESEARTITQPSLPNGFRTSPTRIAKGQFQAQPAPLMSLHFQNQAHSPDKDDQPTGQGSRRVHKKNRTKSFNDCAALMRAPSPKSNAPPGATSNSPPHNKFAESRKRHATFSAVGADKPRRSSSSPTYAGAKFSDPPEAKLLPMPPISWVAPPSLPLPLLDQISMHGSVSAPILDCLTKPRAANSSLQTLGASPCARRSQINDATAHVMMMLNVPT